jgi:hypothetical protein
MRGIGTEWPRQHSCPRFVLVSLQLHQFFDGIDDTDADHTSLLLRAAYVATPLWQHDYGEVSAEDTSPST